MFLELQPTGSGCRREWSISASGRRSRREEGIDCRPVGMGWVGGLAIVLVYV